MKPVRLTEKQLVHLIEVSMDLDRFSQSTNQPTGSSNKDIEGTTEEIIQKLEELLNQFKTGKKVSTSHKMLLHKSLDEINKVYDMIKSV